MEKTVLRFMQDNCIPGDAARIVMGISGGPDSMALLYFMSRYFGDRELIAAHLNHCLRENALSEQRMVEKYCSQLNIPFAATSIDIRSIAQQEKRGLEDVGRSQRYRFFRSLEPDLILTAHHKDDLAESVLLHIIRGSGVRGISGIRPLENGIARPFLCCTKDMLVEYCKLNKIPYAIDGSNEDCTYTRNRIRHEIMPELEKINPNITEGLYRLSCSAAMDDACLEEIAVSWYIKHRRKEENGISLSMRDVKSLSPGLASRVVRKACEDIGVPIDFDKTQRILNLSPAKWMPLTTGIIVENNKKRLYFIKDPVV